MKYLLLVSHGGFAEGLKTSLAMFAGDKMEQVIAVGLREGTEVFAADFKEAISVVTDEDSVIVLADIVGGSPLTTALSVLEERGLLSSAIVLGGMNLPMAITSAVMKDMLDGDDFVQAVLPEAQTALQEFKVASSDDEEADDDDDI
ncbi:PTS sugar transporter subunit IIA [Streptococcus loxodontisalivarius]|uniref:PTS system N-acetylgalactosamine-specific IIA component n=1 Tax=Streptococcus loxodontisalivarius TaxID=1349415 RepID=A0ABS2PU51_9STRE|nr:PTS fructose transporter subunit IIA [Streptococcus loxodontisalivarius]MBM7643577.1 PTS system N-acetylgalactosamine-specific IIA component [Streptococcus loxodontisalivarius]